MIKLSSLISKETYEPDDEWIILSYMIMSEDIIKFVYTKYKSKQIKTKHFGQYFQQIFRWVINYYAKYDKPPQSSIKDVFDFYGKNLNKETKDIIESYLERIATEYISYNESENISAEFIKNEVIPRFAKKRETELLIENLQEKIKTNKFEDIEKSILEFNPISDIEEDSDLGTVKPGSIRSIKKYYGEEKDQGSLFRLFGPIGDYIGPISRGKLIAVTGVEKSGKTFFMQEIGFQGVMHHKLKVLDINLEMQIEDKQERFWQRLGNYSVDKENSGEKFFPIFDCENNQYGCCEVKELKNKKQLLSSIDDVISYEERRNWIICQDCRGQFVKSNTKKTKRFIPAIWFKKIIIKEMNEKRILRTIKKHLPYAISNYRIKCFPRFSATLDDIIVYIKSYISRKNFHPDILLIDYPDIMQPINGQLMDRFNIDYNWKKCAGLSQELNCCIIVADQAIKTARNKRSIGTMDTSESKTKDAHLDIRITLNQTEMENELGLQRVGMLFRRKGRLLHNEVMLTQRIATGNPIMDSEFWFNNNTHYPTIIGK